MRALRLAVAFCLAIASPQIWLTTVGATALVTQPSFSLSCAAAQAGQPEICTIARTGGSAGSYVLLQTGDDTAKAGIDYTATKQLIYLKGGAKSATVSIPTFVNPAAAGTLSFRVVIANTTTPDFVSATIIEPAPPTPPPAPPPSGGFMVLGHATAIQACPALNRQSAAAYPGAVQENIVPGQIYNVAGFGGYEPLGSIGAPIGTTDIVILSDAKHPGDGYASLWVDHSCVTIGP